MGVFGRETDLERRLRQSRPEAREALVARVTETVDPTPRVAPRRPVRLALAGGLTFGLAAFGALVGLGGVGGIGSPSVEGVVRSGAPATVSVATASVAPTPVLRLAVVPKSVPELETVTKAAVVQAVRSGKRLRTGAVMPSAKLLRPSVRPSAVVSVQRFAATLAYPPYIVLGCSVFGYPYVNFSGSSTLAGLVTISYAGPSSGTVLTSTFPVGGNNFFAAALGPLPPGTYTASATVGGGQSADCTFTIS